MKQKLYFISFIIVLCLLVVGSIPGYLFAQAVSVRSSSSTYHVGDTFQISVTLNTGGQSANTVSGYVKVPSGFSVSDIRYGNSIISLWVTSPKYDGSGITFAGGTPGGYTGSSGPLFTFVLRATQEGTFTIPSSDVKILLNDGQGTEINNVQAGSQTVTILKAEPKPVTPNQPSSPSSKPSQTPVTPTAASNQDTTPPEHFIPLISQHPMMAENKYFVSFVAQDKDTGVAYYEVMEAPLFISSGKWVKSKSPYVLVHQNFPGRVYVRAYDNAGNMTESFATKPASPVFWIVLIIVLMVVSIAVTYIVDHLQSRWRRDI